MKLILRSIVSLQIFIAMDKNYTLHTLKNGLRVVYSQSKSDVSYCGLATKVGSRDELDNQFGLAHFVEHTIFKGTKKRRAWHILNRMELVGGELNAYTTKEETLIYSVFPRGNMARAMELISDLVMNSVFPEKEIEKEREVVIEEIQSYLDTPSEAIYDDFEDLIFKGTSLGHNILGDEQCLYNLYSEDCMNYLKSNYVPENMVLFAVSKEPAEKIFRLAERHFGGMNKTLQPRKKSNLILNNHFNEVRDISSHQAHTIVGTPTYGMHDERKYALLLLNNILGGPGMNSTLNVAIRERHGYAYMVESSVTLFSDCGLFNIYFGSDSRAVKKCLKLIDNEMDRIASGKMTAKALEAAKKQYIGQLIVSSDSLENYALALGKGILYFDQMNSIEEISEMIRSVSSEQIRETAEMLKKGYSTLTFL